MRVNTILALSAGLAASAYAAPTEPIEIGTTEGTHIGIPELPSEIDQLPPGIHRPIPLDRTTGPEKRDPQSAVTESLGKLLESPNLTPEVRQKIEQAQGNIAAAGGFKKRAADPQPLTPEQIAEAQAAVWAGGAIGPLPKRAGIPIPQGMTQREFEQLLTISFTGGAPPPDLPLPKRATNPLAEDATPGNPYGLGWIYAGAIDPSEYHHKRSLPPLNLTPQEIAYLRAIAGGPPLPFSAGEKPPTKRSEGTDLPPLNLTPQEIAILRAAAAGPPIPGNIPKGFKA